MKWNLSTWFATCIISSDYIVLRPNLRANSFVFPARSSTNISVALVRRSRASFEMRRYSSSNAQIWRTLLYGNWRNLPVKISQNSLTLLLVIVFDEVITQRLSCRIISLKLNFVFGFQILGFLVKSSLVRFISLLPLFGGFFEEVCSHLRLKVLFELFVVLERLNKEHESGQGFARRFQLGGLAILFFWFFLLWLPLLLLLVDDDDHHVFRRIDRVVGHPVECTGFLVKVRLVVVRQIKIVLVPLPF